MRVGGADVALGADGAEPADGRTVAEAGEFEQASALRVMQPHEPFGQNVRVASGGGGEHLGFVPARGQRLLAQHVLARLQQAPAPLKVQMIRERDVHRVDIVAGEGVIVSENFANRYRLGIGDPVRLSTPTEPFERPIVGIIEDYTTEKGTVFLERTVYERYWRDEAIDIINVNLLPGVERNAFKGLLQKAIRGEQRAFIYTQEEWRAWVIKLLDQFFAMMYMQMLVAVFTAAVGIVNALIISTAERKRELGVIRAIGGLRGQLRKMILLEAVVIGLIGLFAAVIAGVFNTYFLTRTAASMIGGYTIPFMFPAWLVLIALPIVLAIALLAAWWPARRAVRMSVIEAIGYE